MTLPAGSYLGQVGRFAPLSGLSAADVHNVAKARALASGGLSMRGVAGLGDVWGDIACGIGTGAGSLYTGGSATVGGSTTTTSSWGSGTVALGIDAVGTGLAAAACPPTTAPAPALPAAPAPAPSPQIIYMQAPQQAPSPFLQPRSGGIDQNTLLIVGGLVVAAIVAVVILK